MKVFVLLLAVVAAQVQLAINQRFDNCSKINVAASKCYFQRRKTTTFLGPNNQTKLYGVHAECRLVGLQPTHAYTLSIGFTANAGGNAILVVAAGKSDAGGFLKLATNGFIERFADNTTISEDQYNSDSFAYFLTDHGPFRANVDQSSSPVAGCIPLEEGKDCNSNPAIPRTDFCVTVFSDILTIETCKNRCGFIGAARGGLRNGDNDDDQGENDNDQGTSKFFGFNPFARPFVRNFRPVVASARAEIAQCGCDRNCKRALGGQGNCCADIAEACPQVNVLEPFVPRTLPPIAARCAGSVFLRGPTFLCPDIPRNSPGFYVRCQPCPGTNTTA